MLLSRWQETGGTQSTAKIRSIKPVVHGVREQAVHQRVVEHPRQWLLRQEQSAWSQHAVNLHQHASPVGNVVNDAKVKHSIVGSLRRIDGSGIAHPKPNPRPAGTQSSLRKGNHLRVQVKGVNRCRAKHVENQFYAHPAATANLKHPRTGQGTTHP